jgi:hypothetical protein
MLRKLDAGAAAVLVMVLAEHLLLRNAVKKYYATHLPHYDSVGSYTFAYEVLNAYANDGWWAGVKLATGFGLSLTQPMFAALLAPLLSPTPQSLLLYNSLCLGLLSWSLYALCRALGAGAFKGLAAAALPLVPDGFYWWNGGLQDWQRDPSYFCLLASAFFLFFRHLIVRTAASGAILGVAIALTIISRDSAPGYVLMILGPLFVVWFIALARAGRLRENATALAVPVLIAASGAGLYSIFLLKHALTRFGNAYIFYGWHSGFWPSLRSQWKAPIELLIGTNTGYGASAHINIAIAVSVVLAALVLAAFRLWRIQVETLARPEVKILMLSGLWAFAFTLINLISIVGIGSLHFQQVKPMFYPTLLLFMAAGLAFILSAQSSKAFPVALVATSIFCGALVLATPARIAKKTFDHDPAQIAALPTLVKLTSEKPAPVFAFFWHDGITPDTLRYYSAQRNLAKPTHLAFVSRDGQRIDTAIGVPKDMNIGYMQHDFLHATLCLADFVVVTPRLSWYEREHEMFIFRHGRPVVERITEKLDAMLVFEYSWFDVPLRVYDNRQKTRCDPDRAPPPAPALH